MKRSGLSESLRWLPLLAALGLSLSALALIALGALFVSHVGIPASTPPLGNLAGVARSYLFRNAVWNTARMLAVVSVVVFGITLAVQPRLEQAARRPTWLLALALTPLFLPIPYASFLWRPLFERIDVVNQPDLALGAVALVQVWRLWPLAILAALPGRVAKPTRTAAAVALAATWLALLDVGTPLMAMGGAPFNETHVWAVWAFHTVWVSRSVGARRGHAGRSRGDGRSARRPDLAHAGAAACQWAARRPGARLACGYAHPGGRGVRCGVAGGVGAAGALCG